MTYLTRYLETRGRIEITLLYDTVSVTLPASIYSPHGGCSSSVVVSCSVPRCSATHADLGSSLRYVPLMCSLEQKEKVERKKE